MPSLDSIPDFFVDHETVQQRICDINPTEYAQTRNYLNGAVTYLSPFITHGVISTATVEDAVLENHSAGTSEKFLKELGWREYFHRVWQISGEKIFSDFKHAQVNVSSTSLPAAIANTETGINSIDSSISVLVDKGYMHNHARLWVAALCSNNARTHWYQPARWLYYHLLDGDLASNSLSWQWVAGTFSQRKYIANQDNLNRFSNVHQSGTFLDISYEELANLPVPEVLDSRIDVSLSNQFPQSTAVPIVQSDDSVFLYSIWNLDPGWYQGKPGTRILWIDPEMHVEFAMSPLRWQFVKHWADAIDGLRIFVGDQKSLFPEGTEHLALYTREYPATAHWPGQRDEREWCFERPTGEIKSFSGYWKQVGKSSSYFAH